MFDESIKAVMEQIVSLTIRQDRDIKAVEATYEPEFRVLYERLDRLQADKLFLNYGFREGDLLRATPEFLNLIQDKRERNGDLFTEWTADAVYHISAVNYRDQDCSVGHSKDKSYTGLIPFKLVSGMREAYEAYLDYTGEENGNSTEQ